MRNLPRYLRSLLQPVYVWDVHTFMGRESAAARLALTEMNKHKIIQGGKEPQED